MSKELEKDKVEKKEVETKNEVKVSKEDLAREMGLTLPKTFGDVVFNTVTNYTESGELTLPANYSAGNALKGAMLILQQTKDRNGRPLAEVATKESIAQSLLEMVIQGLDPTANQVYFIQRGNQLTMMRSYFGSMKALRRLDSVADVWANVIYEGDVIEVGFENGREVVVKHETDFANRDYAIKGAYAVIKRTDGDLDYTIMTKKEIDTAWSQTSMKNNAVQQKYPQEMAKRTVLNRAAKTYINTDSENSELVKAYNNTLDNEFDNGEPVKVEHDKSKKIIDI